MKRHNKSEFVKMVYEKVKDRCIYWDTYWIVKAVFECMADIIENGDSLYINQYFTLYPKLMKDKRTGNFGNPCVIPEHYVPYFKTHKILNEACKDLKDDSEREVAFDEE